MKYLFAILLLLSFQASFAQSSDTYKVAVIDENEKGVPDVKVSIDDYPVYTTDKNGIYNFVPKKELDVQLMDVKISKTGYERVNFMLYPEDKEIEIKVKKLEVIEETVINLVNEKNKPLSDIKVDYKRKHYTTDKKGTVKIKDKTLDVNALTAKGYKFIKSNSNKDKSLTVQFAVVVPEKVVTNNTTIDNTTTDGVVTQNGNDKSGDKVSDKPADKTTNKGTDKHVEHDGIKPADKHTEKVADKASDKIADKTPDNAVHKASATINTDSISAKMALAQKELQEKVFKEYTSGFSNISQEIFAEQKRLMENNKRIRDEIQRMTDKLKNEKNLTQEQRDRLKKQIDELEKTLLENALAYKKAEAKTISMIQDLKLLLMQKDSINALTMKKLKLAEEKQIAAEMKNKRTIIIFTIITISLTFLAVAFYSIARKMRLHKKALLKADEELRLLREQINPGSQLVSQ